MSTVLRFPSPEKTPSPRQREGTDRSGNILSLLRLETIAFLRKQLRENEPRFAWVDAAYEHMKKTGHPCAAVCRQFDELYGIIGELHHCIDAAERDNWEPAKRWFSKQYRSLQEKDGRRAGHYVALINRCTAFQTGRIENLSDCDQPTSNRR